MINAMYPYSDTLSPSGNIFYYIQLYQHQNNDINTIKIEIAIAIEDRFYIYNLFSLAS